MKKQRTVLSIAAIAYIVLIVLAFVIDHFNVLKFLGFNVMNLNWDALALIFNNITIIGLFVVTYLLIEKTRIKRNQQQRDTAIILLKQIYTDCKEEVAMLDDNSILKLLVDKCDLDKPICDNQAIKALHDLPFGQDAMIYGYAGSGIITGKELQQYMQIQREYKGYITYLISLFDVNPILYAGREKLIKDLDDATVSLGEVAE